jgi:hypothetical protein
MNNTKMTAVLTDNVGISPEMLDIIISYPLHLPLRKFLIQ